jgi:hypothetical protein
MSTTAPGTLARPWLIYVDGELYGGYRTEEERLSALPEAAASGEEVTIAHWDPSLADVGRFRQSQVMMPGSRPTVAGTPPVMLLCGTGDPAIIRGLSEVAQRCAAAGRSVRMYVSDDAAEQRQALFAPVPWIVWDDHGYPGPAVGEHLLGELLGGEQKITAEALMLGCCWGRTPEFTEAIRHHLAGPTAFVGCERQAGRTHGPLVFPLLLDALARQIGTGASAESLAQVMNTALDEAARDRPVLRSARWQATVLRPDR